MAGVLRAFLHTSPAVVAQEALVALTIFFTVATAVPAALFDTTIHRAVLNSMAVR